jgi:hypothetical protein
MGHAGRLRPDASNRWSAARTVPPVHSDAHGRVRTLCVDPLEMPLHRSACTGRVRYYLCTYLINAGGWILLARDLQLGLIKSERNIRASADSTQTDDAKGRSGPFVSWPI